MTAANAAFKDSFSAGCVLGQPGPVFNRFAVIQQNRITQQDQLCSRGARFGQGLIQIYRALGGGTSSRWWPWKSRQDRRPKLSVVPEGADQLQRLRNLLDPNPPHASATARRQQTGRGRDHLSAPRRGEGLRSRWHGHPPLACYHPPCKLIIQWLNEIINDESNACS